MPIIESLGKRLVTPRQSITCRQEKQPCRFTPKNLERPINLIVLFWTVGVSQSTRKEATYTVGEYENYMPKKQVLKTGGLKLMTYLLQVNSATNCATAQPNITNG